MSWLAAARLLIAENGVVMAENTPARAGTRVSRGQVIGALDNSLKQISLESSMLLLEKNKHDYERVKDLYEGSAATEVDLNNAKYAYESARTQTGGSIARKYGAKRKGRRVASDEQATAREDAINASPCAPVRATSICLACFFHGVRSCLSSARF